MTEPALADKQLDKPGPMATLWPIRAPLRAKWANVLLYACFDAVMAAGLALYRHAMQATAPAWWEMVAYSVIAALTVVLFYARAHGAWPAPRQRPELPPMTREDHRRVFEMAVKRIDENESRTRAWLLACFTAHAAIFAAWAWVWNHTTSSQLAMRLGISTLFVLLMLGIVTAARLAVSQGLLLVKDFLAWGSQATDDRPWGVMASWIRSMRRSSAAVVDVVLVAGMFLWSALAVLSVILLVLFDARLL